MEVAVYAIENCDAEELLDLRRLGLPNVAFANGLLRAAWRQSTKIVDRIVYGTPSAENNYARAGHCRSASSRMILELPAPCPCLLSPTSPLSPDAATNALFLGEFTPRKGITEVLNAWPMTAEVRPEANLTMIGFGSHLGEVSRFADAQGATIHVLPDRAVIHAALREAEVVVLPSQPVPGWREQVGLPISEALSHGCRVVTTAETGLADWLEAHGHQICETGSASAVSEALTAALESGPSAEQTLRALPAVDGRMLAQQWMYAL